MWWIWIPYVISLVLLVYLSNKLGEYVDAMDKKTKLSGAFLGGVLLAAVTSLPELITSITAAIMDEPGMTLGNILGSNVFDVVIIGALMLIFYKSVSTQKISRGNVIICCATLLCSILILLCTIFNWTLVIPGINVNILTPIIILVYAVTLMFTRERGQAESSETVKSGSKNVDEDVLKLSTQTSATTKMLVNKGEEQSISSTKDKTKDAPINKAMALSLQGIIWRFIVVALVLVGVSIAMTVMVDIIAEEYNLARGLAGAVFLGVATSLPEIVSTFSLVRLGNFDAGYGNIIGSCLFNFGVIAIADIFYTKGTVFLTDLSSLILSACLVCAVIVLLVFTLIRNSRLKIKNSITVQIITGILILASYITFLALSV